MEWGPVGAVAVMLAIIELAKWAIGRKTNGYFTKEDRAALFDIEHKISSDQWSKDLHELLTVARETQRILAQQGAWKETLVELLAVARETQAIQATQLSRTEFYNARMIEHFSTMECMRRPKNTG